MKTLLKSTLRIHKNKKFHKTWNRAVSFIASVVVFVTTYALILPALTLESSAAVCGLEVHQHSDDCYEDFLVCEQEESDGHSHDEGCYDVYTELVCKNEEHRHEDSCFDEDGNLVCEEQEHIHSDDCFQEVRELTCGQEESRGHQHNNKCYETVLVCEKEVHTHSEKCYIKDDKSASGTEAADGTEEAMAAAPEKAEEILPENTPETKVPQLDPVNVEAILNKHTDMYYFHAEDGEEVPADSMEIEDWQKVKNDTELVSYDLVRLYLAYTIPAGSLNETNTVAKYRLPENLKLTDNQIKAINKNENGIAAAYSKSSAEYKKYLGAEAVEGDRRPGETLKDGGPEYISAVVKVENVYKNDKYIGQDLIFTFVPYTVEKNQNTYDAAGKTVKAGQKVTGWFVCDFNMSQVEWKVNKNSSSTDDSAEGKTVEKTAEVVFAAENKKKDIKEISCTLKLFEQDNEVVQDNEPEQELEREPEEGTEKEPEEEPENELEKEQEQEFKSGTLTSDGDGYTVTMDYTADAKIPDNARLSVREITAETDRDSYEDYLAQAEQHVAESGEDKANVDKEATRFFDIEILVDDGEGNTIKIEPAAPVNVRIQMDNVPAASVGGQQSDPTVLHFAEEGVETIDSTAGKAIKDDSKANTDNADKEAAEQSGNTAEAGDGTEIRFEAESFSVYSVVYTVVIDPEDDGVYRFVGEDYTITITCPEEANIPAGTKLTVSELVPDSDEYIQRLGQAWYEVNREYFEVEEMRANYNEGMGDLPELHPVNLDAARFFDISFEYNGEKIEPSDAVHVEISYNEGLKTLGDSEPVSGVAHFGEDSIELIKDVETEKDENGGIVSFKYEQGSFSDTGTYVGQQTFDARTQLGQAAAPVYDPSRAITLSALGVNNLLGASEGDGNAAANDTSATLPAPASSKTLTPNKVDGHNDGTYTLKLSVAGSSKSTNTAEVNRSNVLIVMDRSSSMINNNTKTYTSYNGNYENGKTYYGIVGDNYVTLYYNNGKYYRTRTGNRPNYIYSSEYTGQLYTMSETTRLDAEQAALSSLVSELLAKNTEYKQDSQGYLLDENNARVLDENNQPVKVNDIIEISVISFADQRLDHENQYTINNTKVNHKKGDTEVAWTTDYSALIDGSQTNPKGVMSDFAPSGTNWEDALIYAKEVANAKHTAQPDEPVYVIFLTDGEPTAVKGETFGAHHYNSTGGGFEFALTEEPSSLTNNTHRDIDGKNALDRAREILSEEWSHFDAVFTYGDRDDQVRYLQRLVNFAYGNADTTNDAALKAAGAVKEHFYDARDTSALLNAFQSILSRISGTISVGNVTVADGMTTDATATTLVSGEADGFRYSVTGPLGELYSVTASGDDSDPTVTFTINGQTVPGTKKTEHVTRNQVDVNGNPVPDPANPGRYLTVTEEKTCYSATIGTTEYKMALASIESNGQITWDLSAVGTLMSGYTYNCSFIVWPNQDAYDYVAGLNNDLPGFEWDQDAATAVRDENGSVIYWVGGATKGGPDGKGFPSIVKYESGIFSVLTNTNQSVTYSIVDTKTDETTGNTETTYDGPYTKPLEYPDPMDLTGSYLSITKYWDDSMDPQQLKDLVEDYAEQHPGETYSVTLTMYENGKEYKDYTFFPVWDAEKECYTWKSADFSIAPALLVSKHPGGSKHYKTVTLGGVTYYVLNDGHEYTLDEESVDYHFEFSADSYHPALVDGLLYNVKFEVDDNGCIVDGSTATKSEKELETFAGTNTLKGRLYVEKETVVPADTIGLDLNVTTFDVKVTLTDRDGEAISSLKDESGNYDAESGLMYRIHYGPYHPHGSDYDPMFGNYGRSGKKAVMNGVINETIYSGDVIYVGNMPVGTHYEVEETSMPLGWKQVGIVAKNEDGEVDPQQTIYGNKADYVTITNTLPSFDVNILKTCEDGSRPLGGAHFKLFGADYYLTDNNGDKVLNENPTLVADDLVSDMSTGLIHLGKLSGGEYYLVETDPPEGYLPASEPIHIVVDGASERTKTYDDEPKIRPMYVTYTQVGNSLSTSGNGVAISATALMDDSGAPMVDENGNGVYNYSYTLTVTNSSGFELPHTGGQGTHLFTIFGSILTLGAAALLWRRRRLI